MPFDKTNDLLRLLILQDNLWGDFTIGWNPIRSNSLGLSLVRGSVDGLTKIETFDFTEYALGLIFRSYKDSTG